MKKWILALMLTSIAFYGCGCGATTPSPAPKENLHSESKPNTTVIDTKVEPTQKPIPIHSAPVLPEKPFMPTRLSIPAIGVTTEIEPVAALPNGQMGVPESTELVGISYPGILPGSKGNVVLDGHVDSYTGPAVFFNLKKLKPGDSIVVSNNVHKLTYTVESVEIYPTNEAPLERIFGDTTEHRLTLITCTGKYSRKKKEHEKRLVVFTKQKGE
ncbi:class F sortase [Paenibacillus sp. GCM10012306]|uniref:class F sortase n=1 Tax=Paenibacillus sp. GCM10012306 TaxID=3317342 RepID=UPI0036245A64